MKIAIKMSFIALMALGISACNANNKKENDRYVINTATKDAHKPKKHSIKVALLLDTSNSMDGLIDQAKAQLWQIVNELSYAKCDDDKPNLQIAVYEYGNDNLNGSEGYIRQVINFSDDLDEISKQLFSLTTKGGNEYCGHVINTAIDQLDWKGNKTDLRLIFIAGNEPFTQGKVNYKEATKKAHNNDITVNTIFCGDYNQGISSYWKDGADNAHGDYMAINHNRETYYVSSPYDDEILEFNKKLNNTYVAYGNIGASKMQLQADQDSNAKEYSNANAVSRTVSKSSHLYKNKSWDLVDASDDENFKLEEIELSELPSELKGKNKTEIEKHIKQKKKERETIQQKIQELNAKRKVFISKQKSNNNGLESAMIKAIKKQAKNKNYKWE
ncbi:VWA domain-containing protein [uncultured Lacinutrix sp.]|uniref:vWA domain-containing protein n=1 Tax=uncultured Lacinutrix sp. TaxID=574032 RepID=UPI00262E51D3|nr:VWA domain-containing protein [uncultured Lacinutrix sp.]